MISPQKHREYKEIRPLCQNYLKSNVILAWRRTSYCTVNISLTHRTVHRMFPKLIPTLTLLLKGRGRVHYQLVFRVDSRHGDDENLL